MDLFSYNLNLLYTLLPENQHQQFSPLLPQTLLNPQQHLLLRLQQQQMAPLSPTASTQIGTFGGFPGSLNFGASTGSFGAEEKLSGKRKRSQNQAGSKYQLSTQQKERKYLREKAKRKQIAFHFDKLRTLVFTSCENRTVIEMHRIEVLEEVMSLLVTKGVTEKEEMDAVMDKILGDCEYHEFVKKSEAQLALGNLNEETKRRLKSKKEKLRRDRVNALLFVAGIVLGVDTPNDRNKILQKLIKVVSSFSL